MSSLSDLDKVVLIEAIQQQQRAAMMIVVVASHQLNPMSIIPLPVLIELDNPPRLRPTLPPRVNISDFSEDDALLRCRFTKYEMGKIVEAMGLPGIIKTENRLKFCAVDGLFILLRRLSYPATLDLLATEFGRDPTSVSRIFNHMLDLVYSQYAGTLHLWKGLTRSRVRKYTRSITEYDSAVINVWSFIDGTHRDIARPSDSEEQIATFNGKDRTNQLRYQLIVAPDGLFVSTCGPYVGTRHDVRMLQDSKIQELLSPIVVQNVTNMIYGDAAYRGEPLVMHPFIDAQRGTWQRQYNKLMSRMRVRIENQFAKTYNLFAFTSLKKNQRVGNMPVALFFFVGILFVNIHTCMHGCNMPFRMDCPSVEEYLSI